MKSILVIISLLVSLVLSYYAYLFAPEFVRFVDRSVYKLLEVRFGYWSLQHIVFALTVGTIPLISLIPWALRGHTSVKSLFAFNILTTVLITFFVLIVGVWVIFLWPEKGFLGNVKQPSLDFWNYVLVGSSVLTILILVVFSLLTRSKLRLKRELCMSDGQIDQ